VSEADLQRPALGDLESSAESDVCGAALVQIILHSGSAVGLAHFLTASFGSPRTTGPVGSRDRDCGIPVIVDTGRLALDNRARQWNRVRGKGWAHDIRFEQ
jgi:hypothetical protein